MRIIPKPNLGQEIKNNGAQSEMTITEAERGPPRVSVQASFNCAGLLIIL